MKTAIFFCLIFIQAAFGYTPASTTAAIKKMRTDYVNQIKKGRESLIPKTNYRFFNMNLGLMRFLFFGNEITVPAYAQRADHLKAELGNYLKTMSPDFVTLQELWHESEGKVIEELAEELGYFVATSKTKHFPRPTHGLEILIKKKVMLPLLPASVKKEEYERKAYFEKFKFKGVLSVTFRDRSNRKITIANTHLTPVHGDTNIHRTYQIGDLIKMVDRSDAHLYFIGSDMNFSHSYWARKPMNDEEIEHWNRNAFNYEALIMMGKLYDLGALNGTPEPTFSLTENTVGYEKYGEGDEPDQVLDYIFLRRNKGHVKLKSYSRVFDRPLVDLAGDSVNMLRRNSPTDLPLFLSDHFGITARIELD